MIISWRRLILLATLFLFVGNRCLAQPDVSGRWTGNLQAGERIEINIFQKNGELCAQSYDFLINTPASFCRVALSGSWDNEFGFFQLNGQYFIAKEATHIMCDFEIYPQKSKNELLVKVLNATELPFENWLRRASKTPAPFPDKMICFPETDSVWMPPKLTIYSTQHQLLNSNERSNINNKKFLVKEFNNFQDSIIKLQIYDSGLMDGDIVQLFTNNKMVADSLLLSDVAHNLNILMNTAQDDAQMLSMKALALGTHPPVTAYFSIIVKGIKHDLVLTADKGYDGYLLFEFKKGYWIFGN